MSDGVYRYHFEGHLPLEEVEGKLVLSLLAAEALQGEAQVRLDAAHHLDRELRACVIDARTPVGRSVNKLFTTFLGNEFGTRAFRVERVGAPRPEPASA